MSVKTVSACVPVGTIFYTRWGYDQTNVEFYEVVSSTAKMVTVAQIYAKRDSEQYLTPRPGAFVAPIERVRRLCQTSSHDGRHHIKVENWGLYAWEYTTGHRIADTYTHGGSGH